jgi:hypothetical protein
MQTEARISGSNKESCYVAEDLAEELKIHHILAG